MRLRPPCRRALLACALFAIAGAAASQVIILEPPNPAAEAAARRRLRRIEAKAAKQLVKSHGDPADGARLGEALRAIGATRLDHPAPAVRAAVAAARDPAALALAIAGDASDSAEGAGVYEADVLLVALSLPAAAPRQAELWTRAAAEERQADLPLRIAFLERAYDTLPPPPPGGPPAGTPDAFSIASRELDALLGAGLARDAVAAFDAWPAALRERLVAAGGGTSVEGYMRPDQRLSLAAARLLVGDTEGARALLARAPVAAWRPTDGNLVSVDHRDPMAVFRAMLERALAPPGGDDPFPVLAEFAASDLFGPGTAVWGVGVTAYARLAEREGYPAVAAFAWRLAPGDRAAAPAEPALLPAAAARTARRLRAEISEEQRLADAARSTALRTAGEHPRPVARSARDGLRLDQAPDAQLFVLDRAGRSGLVVLDREPACGELYRLEPQGDGLVGVLFGSWTS